MSDTKTDLPAPNFVAMDNPTFCDAMLEFFSLCDHRHPHWRLWNNESKRRADRRREEGKATLVHLTPTYVDLVAL